MARKDGDFTKGKIGPVVYKKYRNKQLIQQAPVFTDSSHTEASKKTASIFGKASTLAKHIRVNLEEIITEFPDGEMVNRLNSEVIHVLNQSKSQGKVQFAFHKDSFSRLNGFEFNQHSMVRNLFFTQPDLQISESQLSINIPDIQLPKQFSFPEEIGMCMLSFGLGMFDLTNGRYKFSTVQSREIKYNYKSEILPAQQFDFEIVPGCLCISVISLQYLRNTFAGKMFCNTINFNPVAILKAFITEGTVNNQTTKFWQKMDFKTG